MAIATRTVTDEDIHQQAGPHLNDVQPVGVHPDRRVGVRSVPVLPVVRYEQAWDVQALTEC
ncbi:hypothetical protein, partial [Virgisporangium aurantiacum]|uniref:hypothetical protein n=1 Tax=Virgisporangium aurantiacum TaxID=175570 RepID=UPI00194E1237